MGSTVDPEDAATLRRSWRCMMDTAYAAIQAIFGWVNELGELCGQVLPYPF
jgi:hypothetical protein